MRNRHGFCGVTDGHVTIGLEYTQHLARRTVQLPAHKRARASNPRVVRAADARINHEPVCNQANIVQHGTIGQANGIHAWTCRAPHCGIHNGACGQWQANGQDDAQVSAAVARGLKGHHICGSWRGAEADFVGYRHVAGEGSPVHGEGVGLEEVLKVASTLRPVAHQAGADVGNDDWAACY